MAKRWDNANHCVSCKESLAVEPILTRESEVYLLVSLGDFGTVRAVLHRKCLTKDMKVEETGLEPFQFQAIPARIHNGIFVRD